MPIVGASVVRGPLRRDDRRDGPLLLHPALRRPHGRDHGASDTRPGAGPVTITDGGTTVLDACLTAVPSLAGAGATLAEEGCAPGNGRIGSGRDGDGELLRAQRRGGEHDEPRSATSSESGGVRPGTRSRRCSASSSPEARTSAPTSRSRPIEALVCGDEVTATLDLRGRRGRSRRARIPLFDRWSVLFGGLRRRRGARVPGGLDALGLSAIRGLRPRPRLTRRPMPRSRTTRPPSRTSGSTPH